MTDAYLSPSLNSSADSLPRSSSPSNSSSSTVTVVTGGPATVTPDDVLNHLLDGAKCAVDVGDLVQAARELYRQIDEEELSSSHPADGSVVKEIKAATKDYSEAIKMSVKMAEHGIIFAVDAVSLCERLSGHSGKDISLFINEMRKIARQAHVDAKNISDKFSAVRRTLLQIIRQISLRTGQIALGELLNKAANNVGKLVDSVHKFAMWWSDAETMISTLKSQITSVDGQSMSLIRIEMVRHNWDVLRKDYVEYKTSIGTLRDFYSVDKTRISVLRLIKILRKKIVGVHHTDSVRK